MSAALYPIARPAVAPPAVRPAPLVVALEALLTETDLVIESLAMLAKQRPLSLLCVPLWLARGKACLRRHLAQQAMPEIRTLPYRCDLVAYLEAERRRGTPLVLVGTADQSVARAIAAHLGLFEQVFASDGSTEFSGRVRRDRLVAEFGARGFDYAAGNPDDPAWAVARDAFVLGDVRGQPADVAGRPEAPPAFQVPRPGPGAYLRALRPHHWLKNALLFVPLIAADRLFELDLLSDAVFAFVAFGLCASSAYVLNDLLDLQSDRRHPRKKNRPLASGRLPMVHGAGLIPILLAGAVGVSLLLPPAFLAILAGYYVLTLAYSLRLRDVAILDALALAGLYTIRVIAGTAAVGIAASVWLLAFCVFLFFSLAMIKRYAELVAMRALDGTKARARAYLLEDSELLATLGVASGYLAVLVLALSIDPEAARTLFGRDQLVGLVCMLLLYWISRMWLMAHRARMPDDPLVFALKDQVSRALIIMMSIIPLIPT